MAVPAESLPDHATIEAIARKVAQLLGRDQQPDGNGLLTAGQVAARFNVERSWVYAHADELGVVRLGQGSRPRLRFEPVVVAQRILARPAAGAAPAARPLATGGRPLLPIRPSRSRRTLGSE